MSDNLRAFLQAWLAWAEAGAPDSDLHTAANPARFDAQYGLCSNTHAFEELALGVPSYYTGKLEEEIGELFRAQGLCKGYPFGQRAYDEDADAGTHHLSPQRLEWVRAQLQERTCAT